MFYHFFSSDLAILQFTPCFPAIFTTGVRKAPGFSLIIASNRVESIFLNNTLFVNRISFCED